MTKSFLAVALALVLLIFGAASAAAQTATARIEGRVTDSTGAVLPGTTVTATNVGTNASRVDVTDAKGAYTIAALPVGDYRVQVELSGFKPEVTPITLTVNQVARMDFRLQLGGVTEVMTVTAAAPLIEKSTSEISTLIDEKQIENLPLNGATSVGDACPRRESRHSRQQRFRRRFGHRCGDLPLFGVRWRRTVSQRSA